jgi:hypothetical protein
MNSQSVLNQVKDLSNKPVVEVYDNSTNNLDTTDFNVNIGLSNIKIFDTQINLFDTPVFDAYDHEKENSIDFNLLVPSKPIYIAVPDYIYNNYTNKIPPPTILTKNINGVEMTTQYCIDNYNLMIQNLCII